jgi:hypothetical protein
VDSRQVLAFRLARSGLAAREARSVAEAAACPASDFATEAALLALGARFEGLTREGYERAVDAGTVVLAHAPRGAIHALRPGDAALYGRALLAADDDELGAQLGQQIQRLAKDKGFAPTEALEEVADATRKALARGRVLSKDELHEEYRARVRDDLLPWCKSCKSHHVPPMLWRYATTAAGARLDSQRHYLLEKQGRVPSGKRAVLRFLSFYGPSTASQFADWSGVATPHAKRLWEAVEGELAEVSVNRRPAWIRSTDLGHLESPPATSGVRLIPAGDPYLQKPNRALLAPDEALRKRLFRPVASPGAVLRDGVLAGLWRAKVKGRKLEVAVERIGRVAKSALEEEAERMAALRGAAEAKLTLE